MKLTKLSRGLVAIFAGTLLLVGCSNPNKPEVEYQKPAVGSFIGKYRTQGFTLQPIEVGPYEREYPLLDLEDPTRPTRNGVFYFEYGNIHSEYHPVGIIQYALSSLHAYKETSDKRYLDAAMRNAEALLEGAVEREGALYFSYPFDWSYYEVTLNAPWWSAMGQGQALSLFVYLDDLFPGEGWDEIMHQVFLSFQQPYSPDEPVVVVVDDGYIWLDEYAGNAPPLKVLNGQVFALYGLYDYFMKTNNQDALKLFDGGATTVLENFHLFREVDGPSYYCAREDYCRTADWQNHFYHPIHIEQLHDLAAMTGDQRFDLFAEQLASDFVFEQ